MIVVCVLCRNCVPSPIHLDAQSPFNHDNVSKHWNVPAREKTKDFKQDYKQRAGIEGTISQGVRAFGLRQCRYIGHAKTHLQHILTAMVTNIVRVVDWLNGERPTQTRVSSFARLDILSNAS
jgi:transposase